MRASTLLLFALIISTVPYAVNAYSMQSVNTLLSNYNVSNAMIKGLTATAISYNSMTYVALYTGTNLSFLVNTTGEYFFVLNDTSAYAIIKNRTQSMAFAQANFTYLKNQMLLFKRSSADAIDSCLVLTGLDTGSTCTLDNYCESCGRIPLCKCGLTGYGCPAGISSPGGGPAGIFGRGIMQFEAQYDLLNASYKTFDSAILDINKSNALLNIAKMNAAFLNISNVTNSMYRNSIFPPSPDITPNVLSGCINYISASVAPWYCTALGYCPNLNYNYTKLALINSSLKRITNLPLSNAQVLSVAQNATNNALHYAYPILSKVKLALLFTIINASIPNYGILVNNSAQLLTHVNDLNLSSDLHALVTNYNSIVTNYFTANLTQANLTLSSQYANLTAIYRRINASYSTIFLGSRNNTVKLIELQVSRQGISPELASLAFSQFSINLAMMSGTIADMSGLASQVSAVSSKLSSYSVAPISLIELARFFDAPFIRSLAASMNLGYSASVALSPVFGAVMPLMIGIVITVGLALVRFYLKIKHRLVENQKIAKNWLRIYLLMLSLTLLWAIATYVLLAFANSSAPFSAFSGAYASSPYVVIAINGTPTINAYTCASKISAHALTVGKTPVVISFINGQCTVNNGTRTVDSCLDFYARSNIPVVSLNENTRNVMGLYSLYGTVLSASGNDTMMSACYPALLT
jgi:hypothetical protein